MTVKWTEVCKDNTHLWGQINGDHVLTVILRKEEGDDTHYIMVGKDVTISGHVPSTWSLAECQAKALEWYQLLLKEGLA